MGTVQLLYYFSYFTALKGIFVLFETILQIHTVQQPDIWLALLVLVCHLTQIPI